MATSNYDVNVQLALAITAECEGDLDACLGFLTEAHRTARASHEVQAQVHLHTAQFHARQRSRLPMITRLQLCLLAAVF